MFGLLKRKAATKGRIGIAMTGDRMDVAVVRRESGGSPLLDRYESIPINAAAGPDAAAAA